MIDIKLHFNTPEEAIKALEKLNGLSITTEIAPTTPRLQPEQATEGPVTTEGDAATQTAPGVTKEEARAALNDIRSVKGIAVVKTILGGFGVTNFNDLSPDKYPDIMKEAKKIG